MTNKREYYDVDKMYEYLRKIKNDDLFGFIADCIETYGTAKKLRTANKVADIVWQKFIEAGFITSQGHQNFVDITIAASLIYNLFYKSNDITTILKHRVKLPYLAEANNIDETVQNYIYEIIECQLGEKHPIQRFKPVPNSPTATFAEAVWYVEKFKSNF